MPHHAFHGNTGSSGAGEAGKDVTPVFPAPRALAALRRETGARRSQVASTAARSGRPYWHAIRPPCPQRRPRQAQHVPADAGAKVKILALFKRRRRAGHALLRSLVAAERARGVGPLHGSSKQEIRAREVRPGPIVLTSSSCRCQPTGLKVADVLRIGGVLRRRMGF